MPRAHAHVSGHRLGRGQVADRRRACARLSPSAASAVRPFKPQNMSNNAAVTGDGGEIGRAQALQARAACTPASVHMNPGAAEAAERDRRADRGAGPRLRQRQSGRLPGTIKHDLLPYVLDSYARLRERGRYRAGRRRRQRGGSQSSGKRHRQYGICPRRGRAGGADRRHRSRRRHRKPRRHQGRAGAARMRRVCAGFIVNKFRGDAALFAEGMARIAQATGWEALGLVPHFADARLLPAEDALALERRAPPKPDARVRIAVPILPHIANFDDLDPLDAEPDVDLVYVRPGEALPGRCRSRHACPARRRPSPISPHCARPDSTSILPRTGAAADVILGLCGGYQMLGRSIADPGRNRRPGRHRRGARLARCRDHAIGGEAARSGVAVRRATARRFAATKCIWA